MVAHFMRFMLSTFVTFIVAAVIIVGMFALSRLDTDPTAGGAYVAMTLMAYTIAVPVTFIGMEVYLYWNNVR